MLKNPSFCNFCCDFMIWGLLFPCFGGVKRAKEDKDSTSTAIKPISTSSASHILCFLCSCYRWSRNMFQFCWIFHKTLSDIFQVGQHIKEVCIHCNPNDICFWHFSSSDWTVHWVIIHLIWYETFRTRPDLFVGWPPQNPVMEASAHSTWNGQYLLLFLTCFRRL